MVEERIKLSPKADRQRFEIQMIVYVMLIISFALIIYMVVVQSNRNKKHFCADEWEFVEYEVQQGDDYRVIADKFCPDFVDKNEYIYNLVHINGKYIDKHYIIIVFIHKEKGENISNVNNE